MGDKFNDGDRNFATQEGRKNESSQNEGSKLDWHHLWKSVEKAGSQAGSAIKKQVDQIDTKELAEKAKHGASEGLKIARGKSDNKQANEYSDAAAKFIPGAGLLRKGAEIAHETGADGKVLEGKKGPLHAPSERTLREASSEAVGTMIPLPGGGIIGNEILNRSGVKQKIVDKAFDAAKEEASAHKDIAHGIKPSPKSHLPELKIENEKKDGVLDSSKKKVQELFHRIHKD